MALPSSAAPPPRVVAVCRRAARAGRGREGAAGTGRRGCELPDPVLRDGRHALEGSPVPPAGCLEQNCFGLDWLRSTYVLCGTDTNTYGAEQVRAGASTRGGTAGDVCDVTSPRSSLALKRSSPTPLRASPNGGALRSCSALCSSWRGPCHNGPVGAPCTCSDCLWRLPAGRVGTRTAPACGACRRCAPTPTPHCY
jgi:hypothetical protein